MVSLLLIRWVLHMWQLHSTQEEHHHHHQPQQWHHPDIQETLLFPTYSTRYMNDLNMHARSMQPPKTSRITHHHNYSSIKDLDWHPCGRAPLLLQAKAGREEAPSPRLCVCKRTLHNWNEIIFLQVLAADDQGTQFVDASWVWLSYRAYYIRVPIGKQAANYKLLVDTGSDTTWLFCQFVHGGNDGYAEPQPQISIKSLHPHPHPHHLSAFSAYPFLHML